MSASSIIARKANFGIRWFSLAIALACIPLYAFSVQNREQDRQWAAVLNQEDIALAKYRVDPSGPETRRAFEKASLLLTGYMTRWIPGKQSVSYLKVIYRLGVYKQLSGHNVEAKGWFEQCARHQHIGDPNVQWDHKPLKELVAGRLKDVNRQSGFSGHDEQPNTEASKDVILIISHGKGGISIGVSKPPAPLSASEAAAVASRLCLATDTDRARKIGAELLKKETSLRQAMHVYASPGMVVFGISGTQAQVEEIGQFLVAEQKRFEATYCEDIHTAPLLYVYANLDPREGEGKGCLLSGAVHFRTMEGLQGYYEPLDNSIVLRKDLNLPNGLYLGTAIHEMIHASIHAYFPNAPLWLNEGMAATFEQQDESQPIENYRLYYLIEALQSGKLPTLKEVIDPKSRGWSSSAQPLMAAAARYLCLYLLQGTPDKNYLKTLFQTLRDSNFSQSVQPLESMTGRKSDQLQEEWVRFIKTRDLNNIDPKWNSLRGNIRRYIEGL
jgi:hypothetical protein